ncbi:unnamed protein product [Adineta steineri]|uniref:Tetratricopeptide repeat protein n=1 Tax=Adineta steineri TaxID=433720 RepID=A0A814SVB4_9BILA|nr:unnamed protein product [Adineta steineri]CAF1482982.1 unnamed protein product [Adineta steineri]
MPVPFVFAAPNHTLDKWSHDQNKFIAFQLFVNILQELPLASYCQQKLYNHCLAYADNTSDCDSALNEVTTHTDQFVDWLVNGSFLSAILNSLLQQQILTNLLDIQQVIVAVNQRLSQLPSSMSSLVVYRAQLIRAHDLEHIKANTGELIAFHTFLLATENLETAREIGRQAANRGLLAVIFEIDVPVKTRIAKVDECRFIFRFGNIFRLQSIHLAPDGVWYAQLRCADSIFQSVQEQLQIQVGERLTWLTLGNYLCALNNVKEAKSYYEHLLQILPKDHEALASIYNNMGLLFTELGEKQEALKYYNLALGSIKNTSPNADQCLHLTRFKALPPPAVVELTVSCSDVYEQIAETYRRQSKPEQALEFYRKALEQTIDPVSRVQYEQKIQETLSLI